MDDDEYYSKMRNHNLNHDRSWLPKKNPAETDYKKWTVQQGHEDAEMLLEKNTENENQEELSD